MRRGAESTITAINAGKPAQVQLADFRRELREALEENKELGERLERLESEAAKEAGKVSGSD